MGVVCSHSMCLGKAPGQMLCTALEVSTIPKDSRSPLPATAVLLKFKGWALPAGLALAPVEKGNEHLDCCLPAKISKEVYLISTCHPGSPAGRHRAQLGVRG